LDSEADDQPGVAVATAIYEALADDSTPLDDLVEGAAMIVGFPQVSGGADRGGDGLRRAIAAYRSQFRDFGLEVLEITARTERVLVRLRLGGLGLSGARLSHEAFHVLTVSDRRCRRIEAFESASEAAGAAGLDGARGGP
jgi:hypothetical protein